MVIYKITNKLDGQVYIGQTVKALNKRRNEHFNCDKNTPLYAAIRKYGRENFTLEPLCSALKPEYLNELEVYFIAYYNSLTPNGYNLTAGGDSAFKRSEHTKKKQSNAMLGHTVSEETRAKISASLMGQVSPRKGVTLSSETRKKISEVQLGKKASEVTKARMAAAKIGSKAYNAKAVMCIETGMVYGSTGEAARALGLQQTSISAVCLGKRQHTGKLTFKFVK